MRPLAIIESDATRRAEIRAALQVAGFRTETFADPADALPDLHDHGFALTILDIGTGGEQAFALCREASALVPVIALATDPAEEICVGAFASGVDDCVPRNVAARELVARVRNVLRRSGTPLHGEGEHADLSTSVTTMRVQAHETTHNLTRGEAELLGVLLECSPRPVTPLQIAQMLHANRGTIESRLKTLRRKLGAERLVSRGRLGYQLLGE
ncbi:MAG TPA: response regulator transcription factor [Thermoanaerobaculia bacterium]|nr:response regulator transcription factor [Thermoanaerobaculia bacterium]